MMKDLYSVHATEEDFWKYYERVKVAYSNVFRRLGFDFRVTEAAGGVFTDNKTHEFQVIAEGGEDTIYVCEKCDWGINEEIFEGKEGDKCPKCGGNIVKTKSVEVGNIFPFGTWYSERMKVYYTDTDGKKKPVWFGSYGIGSTRVMGAWVEISHDDKGIIWNKAMAPFDVHLIDLPGGNAKKVYETLTKAGLEVLWDNREISAGEKFADSDLIGIPARLIVSDKTGDKIEWKERASEEKELFSLEQVTKKLKS